MIVDTLLRARARQLIETGKVPSRLPARRWGGPGSGTQCMVCGAPVRDDEVGVEIEFSCDGMGAANHDFHVHCLEALELELRESGLARRTVAPGAQLQPVTAPGPDARQAGE